MRIKGRVETFTPRMVSGWLTILGGSSQAPKLEVLLDGVILASAMADEYRPDIAAKGFNDGRCQFRIILPQALNDEEMSRLRLRIEGSGLFLELPRPVLESKQALPLTTSALASPVFIVGSPRSGTSVLTLALAAVGYHGYWEGNLLGLSHDIEQGIDRYLANYDPNIPETLLANVNIPDLKNRLFLVFKEILDQLNPREPWFDKTGNPEAILLLPRIMKAWPASRVIFAKRHGIENVSSRLLKFPAYDFVYHCRDWASNMRAWRMTREQLDTGRIIEIDQRELLEAPGIVATKLAQLLSFSEDKKNSIEKVFQTKRPQESFPGSAEKRVRINDTGWTFDQIKVFEKFCREEMNFYGYQ